MKKIIFILLLSSTAAFAEDKVKEPTVAELTIQLKNAKAEAAGYQVMATWYKNQLQATQDQLARVIADETMKAQSK